MKLSAFKNNQLISEVDLSTEIAGIEDGERNFFIGRSESCHLTIEDIGISREHIQIIHEKGVWKMKKNTDFGMIALNGTLTDESEIKHGDIIAAGAFQIIISDATANVHTQDIQDDSPPPETQKSHQEDDSAQALQEQEEQKEIQEEQEDAQVKFDEIPEENVLEQENMAEAIANNDIEQEQQGDQNPSDENNSKFQMDMEQGENPVSELQEDGFHGDEQEGGGDLVANPEENEEDKTSLFNSFVKYELELFGENIPYDNYVIEQEEIFIGRDPNKCQIILQEKDVSVVHAVIRSSKGLAQIEDLNSSNGTIYNGKRVNKASIADGDEFIIGSTTFTVKVQSDLLEQEEGRLMPVEENISSGDTGKMEIGNFSGVIDQNNETEANSSGKSESLIGKIMSDPQKKRRVIMYGSLILVFLFVYSEDGEQKKETAKKTPKKKESNLLVQTDKQKSADKSTEENKNSKEGKDVDKASTKKRKLTAEQEESLERTYKLAEQLFEEGKFSESIFELEKIVLLNPDYKEVRQRYALAKKGLARLEELEQKRQKEEDQKIRDVKVKGLLVKAKDAVENKKIELAEGLFSQILQLDPENFDTAQLKLEIDAYKKDQERIAVEKAQKDAERKRQLTFLAPGKKFYLSEQWYKAIIKLEEFLEKKDIDEDLVEEATKMLAESRKSLDFIVSPKLSKARSLKEGKDLKQAYEVFIEILKDSPGNVEALNEMDEIRIILNRRSKKIYREAIVSEDLSLFEDAREKFEEVKQISPSDSPYYKKAVAKLEDYID